MQILDEIASKQKKLIVFDGVCKLCNNLVLKIIKYDKKNSFLFTSLQSKKGKEIINELGIDISKIDSIIVYVPKEAYYTKSSAALKVIKDLSGFWKLLQIASLLPTFIADFLYDYIARKRYKWFGKEEQCMIPSQELKDKFLD